MPNNTHPVDPAAAKMTQEPRSLFIPTAQSEQVGFGVTAIPGRIVGGVAVTVEAKTPNYIVSLDISKLQAAGPLDPGTAYVPTWIPGTPSDQVRRIPISAIPADAPSDGVVYGRQSGLWTPVDVVLTPSWDDIQDKPDSFPPTVPIAQEDVTDLVTDLAFKEPVIPLGDPTFFWRGDKVWAPVTGGSGGGSATWPVPGTPSTFPPTLPIPQSGVTSLEADQDAQNSAIAAKEPLLPAGGTTTTFLRGDKQWMGIGWSAISGVPATFPPTLPIPSSGVTGLDTKQASQDTAITGKENAISAGTTAQYWRGDKQWIALNSSAVGLGNVNNTADTAKPVSTAQQAALDLKANIASPALTGNPTAPTQTAGNSTTRLATTAFVQAAVAGATALADIDCGTFSGSGGGGGTPGAPPASWDDPIFASVTELGVQAAKLSSYDVSDISIIGASTNGDPQLDMRAGGTVRRFRLKGREGLRIGGGGTYLFEDGYIEFASGGDDDHADGIQFYCPGTAPTVTFRRVKVVGLTSAFGNNCAVFIADDARANLTFEDCEFHCTDAPGHGSLFLSNFNSADIAVNSVIANRLKLYNGWDFVGGPSLWTGRVITWTAVTKGEDGTAVPPPGT